MAQKKFKQNFARDFKGIDGLMSALEDDDGAVNRAVNYEFAVSNSLRGRVGCQTSGGYGFFGIFPYSYTRTQDEYKIVYQVPSGDYGLGTTVASLTTSKTVADGATINNVVAINQQAWVLDTMNVVATYVSGDYPFTHYTTVSGSNINFVIKANGASILNTSLGDGITTRTSIYDLIGTIGGLGQLNTSYIRGDCPPFAQINGAQDAAVVGSTNYASTYSVTVDAGHTFYPGDIICFPTCQIIAANGTPAGTMAGGMVTAITATTITYAGIRVYSLADNAILGYMGQPAAAFPITTAVTTSSGNITIGFKYWRLITEGSGLYGGPFIFPWTLSLNKASYPSSNKPPVAVNADGNLYIAGTAIDFGLGIPAGYHDHLVKSDGTQLVNAGPLNGLAYSVAVGGAGALTGTYKYKVIIRATDAQGNIIEGRAGIGDPYPALPAFSTGVSSITYAANYGTVQVAAAVWTGTEWQLSNPTLGFHKRYGTKQVAESSSGFFYVDSAPGGTFNTAFIQPGDPIHFLDNTNPKTGGGGTGLWVNAAFGVTALGAIHKVRCTDYCAPIATVSPTTSSIKVDSSGAGFTINADSPIGTGLTYVVYRTTAGGNVFYELCEIPIDGRNPYRYTFHDDVADSILTSYAQYQEPEIGKEHDAPRACSLVCSHQGGLVVSGGAKTPNTVAFSSVDGIEYFPLASNSFDVPSTQNGGVTAIASDTNDRLAVFKERAYYDVVGDLDGGVFSINVKNEGDYGISSQASISRVNGTLIGLSKNGYVLVSDGNLIGKNYKDLDARLINQSYYFNWATAVNDSLSRKYICCIPTSTNGSPITHIIDYSRGDVKTFEASYATYCDMAGGMAVVGNDFYHLSEKSPNSVLRRLERFNSNSPGSGDGDSFIDNTSAISYILESNVINNGEPDILNTPIRIRVWSIPNDYILDGWVTFSVLVEGGASPIATYIGSGNPGGTSSTLTFSTTNDIFKDIKLVQSVKTHFYIVRFTTNTIRTAPFITGYDILYAENYNPEDLVK